MVAKKRTALQRAIGKETRSAPNEQPAYYRKQQRAAKAARVAKKQGPSKGKITTAERHAIKRAAGATKLITTPGEAAGVKKILRKKARRS